jgi:hypothetical protein
MFWRRGYTLGGEVGGGWALEFPSFLGPVKWHPCALCTGVYKSQVHRLFYAHEGDLGPHTQDDPAGCVCGGRGGRGGAL